MIQRRDDLPRRPLGRTGVEVSVLGLGGFHQVEVSQDDVEAVVDRYLAAGGNYVETAAGYGAGASETKLGRALAGRRDDVFLATKSHQRTYDGARRQLEESLQRLQTSRLDAWFFHNIGSPDVIDQTAAADGALRAFREAREEGVVGLFGMSSHWPPLYLEAARRLPLDVVLIWGNYLDFCSFPEIPNEILPELRERGIGILFMKPLADGYLHRSPRAALRYALAGGADGLVSGFNSVDLLETDLAVCCDPSPVTQDELATVLRDAPELGRYVCRQCATCPVCDDGELLKTVFALEGKVDRQMDDRRPVDAATYALRERLKGWFGTAGRAGERYAALGEPAARLLDAPLAACPFGLDIPRKLRIAHAKLAAGSRVELV